MNRPTIFKLKPKKEIFGAYLEYPFYYDGKIHKHIYIKRRDGWFIYYATI